MKIKSIILNVLFIIILICLIYFFIYLNNSNFEKFDANAFTDGDVGEIVAPTVDNPPTPGLSKYEIETPNPLFDGKTSARPLMNVNHAQVLIQCHAIRDGNEKKPVYKDGYYWISIPDVGSSYIYCIMDTNYFGGGWMLAMRSVYGSRNFYYDSPHFKSETTLNDNVNYINNNFKDILKNEEQLAISSIGDLIYKKEPDAPNKYDAKFHTFNKSRATEWMAIFYVINPETKEKIIGGDLKAPHNKRGWIWKENNVDIDGEYFSALNLFKELDKKGYQNKFKDLTRKYIQVTDTSKAAPAFNMGGKFINALDPIKRTTNNQIFSSQKYRSTYTNVYGINYDRAHRLSKMRWGFNFNDSSDNTNDAFSGIGTSYVDQGTSGQPVPNQNGYSAGNFEMKKELSGKDVNESNFYDRPINANFRNSSYAVEWYVREKNY